MSYLLGRRALRTTEDKQHWSSCWLAARTNMPKLINHPKYGKNRILFTLLGYKVWMEDGRPVSCSQRFYNYSVYGYAPRDPKRRALLQAFAGRNGAALAKAAAIQQGFKPKL